MTRKVHKFGWDASEWWWNKAWGRCGRLVLEKSTRKRWTHVTCKNCLRKRGAR